MDDIGTWIILGCFMLNFITLNGRRSVFVRNPYYLYFIIVLFGIGIVGVVVSTLNAQLWAPAFWGLTIPFIFLAIDYGFAKISFSLHGRDYYLWLKGSPDLVLNDFKASDKFFSILMLLLSMLIMVLPFILSQLVRNILS
jgi:hypothetical protein